MIGTLRTTRAVAAGLFIAASGANAQVGPGVHDLPPAYSATPATTPQTVGGMAAAPVTDRAAPAESRPGTPLGIPAPAPAKTALIDPDAPGRADGGFVRTATALAGVLCLIVGLSWVYKRAARASGGLAGALGAGGRAPAGLVEVLARYPLASRHTLVVLRFDRRVLLCSMTGGSRASGAGMTVLTELTEPEDVASVLVKARDQAGESIARSFERSLREAEKRTDEAVRPEPVRVRRPETTPATASVGYRETMSLRRGLESMRPGGRR